MGNTTSTRERENPDLYRRVIYGEPVRVTVNDGTVIPEGFDRDLSIFSRKTEGVNFQKLGKSQLLFLIVQPPDDKNHRVPFNYPLPVGITTPQLFLESCHRLTGGDPKELSMEELSLFSTSMLEDISDHTGTDLQELLLPENCPIMIPNLRYTKHVYKEKVSRSIPGHCNGWLSLLGMTRRDPKNIPQTSVKINIMPAPGPVVAILTTTEKCRVALQNLGTRAIEAKLDEKGRIVVPYGIRIIVAPDENPGVTSGESCAVLFPVSRVIQGVFKWTIIPDFLKILFVAENNWCRSIQEMEEEMEEEMEDGAVIFAKNP